MVQYKLNKEWWNVVDNEPFDIFKIIDVDITNVFDYESDIRWLIESFHKRYDWSGFPTWEVVINRLESGKNFFFLCEYNDKIIGWGWWKIGEVDINKENIKFYCKTNDTTAWAYNDFIVSNKIVKKPENSGTLWGRLMLKRLFERGMDTLLADVESWQPPAITMCEDSGMKQINWITELISNA